MSLGSVGLVSLESLLKRGSLPAVRPQCTWAADLSIVLMLGWERPLSQLRRRTLKYPVPTKMADTECTSPNGMASGVTYCCHWIAAVHDYTICTIFQTLPFFFWINLFQQLLVYLVCSFSPPFFEVPWHLNQTPWSRTSRMPPKCRLRIFHSCPCSTQWTPGRELTRFWEGNSRLKNGPVKSSDFFRNPAIGFQGV